MTKPRFDVLGIGNAIVDIIAESGDDFLTKHGLDKGTMRLIDEAEATRLYGDMGPAIEISGGSAANTIAGVAALG
ncbi:MAG: adenosine kinase, partial [Rhodospirillaceae bacterium]|nr:adenosine kinase [Rhodospirillaceae bacterium]